MLGDVFYWVFNMSIAAIICGIPVLLLRLCKRIPRRVFILLWIVPLVRLCVPFGLSGKYGLMALISKFATKTVTLYQSGFGADMTAMNYIMGANSYFPITYKVDLLAHLFDIASIIWILVALALLFAFFMIYATTTKELRDAKPLQAGVYVSEKVSTPALYGIIKPRIVLPKDFRKDDLAFILAHEEAHKRRGDNLMRILALTVACVHWFNPFAWLFLKLYYADIELACDEAVLAGRDEEEKKEYAHALLTSVERSNVFAATFGGARIRTRIENILSYKRLSAASAVACAILILSMFYVLLTNA